VRKKVLWTLFLALFLAFSLGACGGRERATCREVLGAMIEGEVGLPAGSIYDMRAAEGSGEYLPSSLLYALYGEGGKPPVADDWLDCALFLSLSEHPCELAVLYCNSHDAAIDTARLLNTRLDVIRVTKGKPEHAAMLDSARVTVNGNFVLMIISSDTENAQKLAQKVIK